MLAMWQTICRLCYWFQWGIRIHKSYINTGKIRCGVASHPLNVCESATCTTNCFQEQLNQHVFVREEKDVFRCWP